MRLKIIKSKLPIKLKQTEDKGLVDFVNSANHGDENCSVVEPNEDDAYNGSKADCKNDKNPSNSDIEDNSLDVDKNRIARKGNGNNGHFDEDENRKEDKEEKNVQVRQGKEGAQDSKGYDNTQRR